MTWVLNLDGHPESDEGDDVLYVYDADVSDLALRTAFADDDSGTVHVEHVAPGTGQLYSVDLWIFNMEDYVAGEDAMPPEAYYTSLRVGYFTARQVGRDVVLEPYHKLKAIT